MVERAAYRFFLILFFPPSANLLIIDELWKFVTKKIHLTRESFSKLRTARLKMVRNLVDSHFC